jgi:xylan 1,4-beta-xylosidase
MTLLLAYAAFLTAANQVAPLPASLHETKNIEIDLNGPAKPFPHFWEKMFGSGRAILSLRQGDHRFPIRPVSRHLSR